MARCVDCYWFENPAPIRREPESCRDLGELAQNQTCDRFELRQVNKTPRVKPKLKQISPEEVEQIIGALKNESYREAFHEILVENFVLAQDSKLAIDTIQYQLQTQGANVIAPSDDFQRYADKLQDLYVLYRLANAMGLGGFVDRIMEREIANKFRVPDKSKVPDK